MGGVCGYHNLQTIFYPVPLCDELTIREDRQDSLTLGGHTLDGKLEDNLVLRAIRLLRESGHDIPHQSITLNKIIPSGAGLGGGSSDAACIVKSINERYEIGLSDSEMERMVSRLGADCPFFIKAQPVYAEGIGDIFTPISLSLKGWHLMLVKPDIHVSTRDAYAGVHPHMPKTPLLNAISQPICQWRNCIVNDFEESIFPLFPRLERIKEQLYIQGATYAAMSGSGSTLFGLFAEKPDCQALFDDHFVYCCQL